MKKLVGAIGIILAILLMGCGKSDGKELTYTLSADGTYYEVKAEREANMQTTTITIQATYKDKPVVVATEAFYGLPMLEKVVVEGAQEIKSHAFMSCPQLKEIEVKDCKTIGERAIRSCQNLESLTIGDGVEIVGKDCLVECPNLKALALGKDLKEIGQSAFSHCGKLTEVVFPTENELVIGDNAFEYCGILELKIPENVRLGSYSFGHLAWNVNNEGKEISKCKSAYFYSTEPTKEYLGTNSIGFTWDRSAKDDAELGDFMIYVPEGYEDIYENLMLDECDESWGRCVISCDRLATFNPEEKPYK